MFYFTAMNDCLNIVSFQTHLSLTTHQLLKTLTKMSKFLLRYKKEKVFLFVYNKLQLPVVIILIVLYFMYIDLHFFMYVMTALKLEV
jgi:hypothetical protein